MQPDTVTGDIVFLLQLKEHPKFKRKQDDLYVEHNISLTEALCGFQFVLTHLDDRQLLIKTNPGEVIKPGTRKLKTIFLDFHYSIFLPTLKVKQYANYDTFFSFFIFILDLFYEMVQCSRSNNENFEL